MDATPIAEGIMAKHKVELRTPWMAALLAFLIPGLGHLYQGRFFKAILYFVCIMATFACGMRLGDFKVLYFDPDAKPMPYYCQLWAGLPALAALGQAYLRPTTDFEQNHLEGKLTGQITGKFVVEDHEPSLFSGTVTLTAVGNFPSQLTGEVSGELTGPKGKTSIQGQLLKVSLDQRVAPDAVRQFSGTFEGTSSPDKTAITGRLEGGFPRGWKERYAAPLLDADPNSPRGRVLSTKKPTDLEQAHADLGRYWDLGVLYTMVAGLLNVFAIFDAWEGPAYPEDEAAAAEASPTPA